MGVENPHENSDSLKNDQRTKLLERITAARAILAKGKPQETSGKTYDSWYGATMDASLLESRLRYRALGEEVTMDNGTPFCPNLSQEDCVAMCDTLGIDIPKYERKD